MMTYPATLVLLMSCLAFPQISARFFSLQLSLPSSPHHSSFAICINQIGAPLCSILSEKELAFDGRTMDVPFVSSTSRSSIQQHLSFTTSINSSISDAPQRRQSSIRLSIDQQKSIEIAPGLILKTTLHCQRHYFGAACSLRCVPTDHQLCDSTGQPICVEGWTGEGCATRVTDPVPPAAPTTTAASVPVTVETPKDNTQLLIVVIMILVVLLCAVILLVLLLCVVILYRTHKKSTAGFARAAREHPTTHHDSGKDAEDGNSSILFKAACSHLQSQHELHQEHYHHLERAGSDSILDDGSYVSALDDESYMEVHPPY